MRGLHSLVLSSKGLGIIFAKFCSFGSLINITNQNAPRQNGSQWTPLLGMTSDTYNRKVSSVPRAVPDTWWPLDIYLFDKWMADGLFLVVAPTLLIWLNIYWFIYQVTRRSFSSAQTEATPCFIMPHRERMCFKPHHTTGSAVPEASWVQNSQICSGNSYIAHVKFPDGNSLQHKGEPSTQIQ